MTVELKMPALSPTMERGTLAKWLVTVGDVVKSGDLIAEIETDKATMELEASDGGRIAELTVPAGTEDVPVGTTIALIAGAEEAVGAPAEPVTAAETPRAAAPRMSAPEKVPEMMEAGTRRSPTVMDGFSENATPLARRIAAAQGRSLAAVSGSGPRGRIRKADLIEEAEAPASSPERTIRLSSDMHVAPPPDIAFERIDLSGMRKTIARRLAESKRTAPHFYLTVRCNLDPLLLQREALNASLEPSNIRLTVNDMMVKALALALVEVPEANVQYGGDCLYRFERVDVAIAIAVPGGLVTAPIEDAASRSLSAIARQSRDLADRARAGKLEPAAMKGGTVSLSNLGMYGIDEMIPVLNPPQAMILGVGAGIEQPWKVGSGIELATVAALTGSFDHRAIDGASAARLMAALRRLVEEPVSLLV